MVHLIDECIYAWMSFETFAKFTFFSLTVLLTGFTITGGGEDFPSGWNPSFPYPPRTLICDGTSDKYAEFYYETVEPTQHVDYL